MKTETERIVDKRSQVGLLEALLKTPLAKRTQIDSLCPINPRSDMDAKWIWVPREAGYRARNSYAFFRKCFKCQCGIQVEIAAETFYDLFVDGRRVDHGTAVSDVSYKAFDTHIVEIEGGEHVIAVLVHHIGEKCATAMQSKPGLFVEITPESGSKILSDTTWKVFSGRAYEQELPCMMSHFGFYEVVDYRQLPIGWTELGFDDSMWYKAEVVADAYDEPWIRMVPRDISLLETITKTANRVVCKGKYTCGALISNEEQRTVAVEAAERKRFIMPDESGKLPIALSKGHESEFVVLDFGREVSGHLKLNISGVHRGQQIDVTYDETLDSRGLPNPRRTYVHFADRYYLREDQSVVEVFNPRGFRYVMLDVPAGRGGLDILKVKLDERLYPIQQVGSFECSNPSLSRLYKTGLQTLRLCMLDSYVDCPSRERVMWMDSYLEGLCSSYGMGTTDLWRRALYLFAQNTWKQGDLAGAVKGFAPCDYDPIVRSYMLYYICSVADYYLHSGDLKTTNNLFDTIVRQFEIIGQFTNADGLIGEDWPHSWGTFLDWCAMDYGGISAGDNAIYILAFRRAAGLAETIGKLNLAVKFRAKAQAVTEAFRKAFWIDREGVFADAIYKGEPSKVRSQVANILAILAGVCNGAKAKAILERITNPSHLLPRMPGDYRLAKDFKCQTGGIVQVGTPALGYLLCQVMFKSGLDDPALQYLEENWMPIGKNGTFAEHFVEDANTSYCHGWSSGPVVLLPQFVLGIRPVVPGWKKIEVNPHIGRLQWARGTVPTAYGEVAVEWEKKDGKPNLKINVPKEIEVVIQ